MAIKDLIKDLTDENRVKVEKIGSGNWYWCWAGEEANEKKKMVAQLEYVRSNSTSYCCLHLIRLEKSKLDANNAKMGEQIANLKEEQSVAFNDREHQHLLEQLAPLEEDVKNLASEVEQHQNALSGGMEDMRVRTQQVKIAFSQATDSIYILESYLMSLAGGDRNAMEAIREECYGSLYVQGEELEEFADN